ncbi:hypothetical protein STRDD11_00296 [Streptococcus sp. DD11]|nr:hypothetical protein STRDD11_00296 [Streptococcus sp. DD11]
MKKNGAASCSGGFYRLPFLILCQQGILSLTKSVFFVIIQ